MPGSAAERGVPCSEAGGVQQVPAVAAGEALSMVSSVSMSDHQLAGLYPLLAPGTDQPRHDGPLQPRPATY